LFSARKTPAKRNGRVRICLFSLKAASARKVRPIANYEISNRTAHQDISIDNSELPITSGSIRQPLSTILRYRRRSILTDRSRDNRRSCQILHAAKVKKWAEAPRNCNAGALSSPLNKLSAWVRAILRLASRAKWFNPMAAAKTAATPIKNQFTASLEMCIRPSRSGILTLNYSTPSTRKVPLR